MVSVLFVGLFVLAQISVTTYDIRIEDTQEQPDGTQNKKQQLKLAEAITSPLLQVNLNFQSFLLWEVAFEEDNEEKKSPLDTLVPSARKALKILFRKIISHNAP